MIQKPDFKRSNVAGGMDGDGRVDNIRKHELYLTGMIGSTSPKVKVQRGNKAGHSENMTKKQQTTSFYSKGSGG